MAGAYGRLNQSVGACLLQDMEAPLEKVPQADPGKADYVRQHYKNVEDASTVALGTVLQSYAAHDSSTAKGSPKVQRC